MKPIKIESDDLIFPADHSCAITGERLEKQALRLAVGAMLMNRRERWGGPSDKMDGFWSVSFRETKSNGSCIEVRKEIVETVKGGQCEILFKGVPQLRQFFTQICDDLESEIAAARISQRIDEVGGLQVGVKGTSKE